MAVSYCLHGIGYGDLTNFAEVILASVLSKMYFEPTEDEIIWNLSQIISPSIQMGAEKEEKGMPVRAVLDDLTV